MARPRTYAPPVAFRLPPPYYDKLHTRAERSGLPLAVYVREVMMDVLDTNGSKPKSRTPRTPITAALPVKTPPKKTAAKKKNTTKKTTARRSA